jgi:hypothetical protein
VRSLHRVLQARAAEVAARRNGKEDPREESRANQEGGQREGVRLHYWDQRGSGQLLPYIRGKGAAWPAASSVPRGRRMEHADCCQQYRKTVVVDWKEVRDLQLAFFKSGVPHIDLPQDHAFFATMYRFAERHGVKYILTGANISTECVRNPLDYFYYGTDLWQIRDIHGKFGQAPLVNFPLSGILRHKVYLRYFKGIEVVKPLNYLPYIKKDAMELLSQKFGWQKYPRKHFESRFTKFYEGYWLPVKFGFDTRKVQYSSMILTGQMTREEALADLRQPPYDEETIAQDFEYIATKLEISVAELQGYLDAPSKSYKDYKNQLHLFLFGARVMQLMGLEKAAVKR